MKMRLRRIVGVVSALAALVTCSRRRVEAEEVKPAPGAVPVTLTRVGTRLQLQRCGARYVIRGAGGSGSKELLAKLGGNSVRTWGVGDETQHDLDEAQRLGLTVTLGIWLGHKEHGFDYGDRGALNRQLEDVKKAVRRYKNHPADLMWGLGNEMENGNESPALWNAIEEIAKVVHALDPNHPTMTVIAEIGGTKVADLHRSCPDIDIVGINSYAGGPSLPERYRKAGGTKPYVVTEFGPPGHWEGHSTSFGAPIEATSTDKARRYRATYEATVVRDQDLCLGAYAFVWGNKVEATSTWFGMLLSDGSRLGAVDEMSELWSGHPVPHPSPEILKLALAGSDEVRVGETVHAKIETKATGPLKFEWVLRREQESYSVQGTGAPQAASVPQAIANNGAAEVDVKMPAEGGVYRLFCYVRDTFGGAAVANVPIRAAVLAGATPNARPRAAMPFVVLASDLRNAPYTASGWMGDIPSINIDYNSAAAPRLGKSVVKVEFRKADGWGGVVWQNPPNDWGDKAGGFDLTGSTKLTLWARGAVGGEKVTFGYGLLGIDKRYHDSATGKLEVVLTRDWKQYALPLSAKDLSCIKTGFYWTVGGQGAPVTFFLDDVRYE